MDASVQESKICPKSGGEGKGERKGRKEEGKEGKGKREGRKEKGREGKKKGREGEKKKREYCSPVVFFFFSS